LVFFIWEAKEARRDREVQENAGSYGVESRRRADASESNLLLVWLSLQVLYLDQSGERHAKNGIPVKDMVSTVFEEHNERPNQFTCIEFQNSFRLRSQEFYKKLGFLIIEFPHFRM
jgi:hypothetical protein